MLSGHASVQQQGSTHKAPSKAGGNESAQLSAGPSLTHPLVLQALSEQNLTGFSGSFAGESTAEGAALAVCVEVTQMAYDIPKKK